MVEVKMSLLSIFGLIFNFLGTGCLAKGLLLTNKQIESISGTYYGNNSFLKQSLIDNRIWAIIGFALIGLGLVLQLIVVLKKK